MQEVIDLDYLIVNPEATTRLGLWLMNHGYEFGVGDWENGDIKPESVYRVLSQAYVDRKQGIHNKERW